jgi:hypothetical protein
MDDDITSLVTGNLLAPLPGLFLGTDAASCAAVVAFPFDGDGERWLVRFGGAPNTGRTGHTSGRQESDKPTKRPSNEAAQRLGGAKALSNKPNILMFNVDNISVGDFGCYSVVIRLLLTCRFDAGHLRSGLDSTGRSFSAPGSVQRNRFRKMPPVAAPTARACAAAGSRPPRYGEFTPGAGS